MSRARGVLSAIWDNTYGLIVDDGRLAAGALVALAISGVVGGIGDPAMRSLVGWVLLALVSALVIANLYAAGRNAKRTGR